MPQIFRPQTGIKLRLGTLAGGCALLALAVAWRAAVDYTIRPGTPVEQPIPFSHKHHVADDGIDCRYCHSTVERSGVAGVPANDVCMTCHSVLYKDAPMLAPLLASFRGGAEPLAWRRVSRLPDFVYFDHSIHIAKGVGCVTCHGHVDRMPLTWPAHRFEMQWCLDCHRQPEKYLRPRERVFDMDWQPSEPQAKLGQRLIKEYKVQIARLTDCSVCHR